MCINFFKYFVLVTGSLCLLLEVIYCLKLIAGAVVDDSVSLVQHLGRSVRDCLDVIQQGV